MSVHRGEPSLSNNFIQLRFLLYIFFQRRNGKTDLKTQILNFLSVHGLTCAVQRKKMYNSEAGRHRSDFPYLIMPNTETCDPHFRASTTEMSVIPAFTRHQFRSAQGRDCGSSGSVLAQQTHSGAARLWCERSTTSARPNYGVCKACLSERGFRRPLDGALSVVKENVNKAKGK